MTSETRRELSELVTAVRAQLESWRETGIEVVPPSPLVAPALETQLAVTHETTPVAAPAAAPAPPPTLASDPSAIDFDLLTHPGVRETQTLEELRTVIGDCQRCKLASHRTHVVYGVGNPDADLVFVGEAPGHDEDVRGEPFVGAAGQLLTEIIVKGMKLRRADVYIANIIKCRPPQNRNPEPDEITACEPFLKQQLSLLKPKVIVALGKVAAQCLMRTRTPISRLRGEWTTYQGIPLMPTFHPAYLLRNPSDKRLVWRDIQQVMATLGLR